MYLWKCSKISLSVILLLLQYCINDQAFAQTNSYSNQEQKQIRDTKKYSDISRLQFRHSNLEANAITASTVVKFPNQIFILARYDNESNRKGNKNNHNEVFETDTGAPVPITDSNLLHAIVRTQKMASLGDVYSGALQLNMSNIPAINDFTKQYKIVTFLQFFFLKNNKDYGREELLHYYEIPLWNKLSIRGYNQFIQRENKSDLYNIWADLIYPVNKHYDLYLRASHRNDNDAVYGQKGDEIWIGFRINYSFFGK